MDKTERWEYYRFIETASDRQLERERIDIEYILDVLPYDADESREVRWKLRVVTEELKARAEVRAYLQRRAQR